MTRKRHDHQSRKRAGVSARRLPHAEFRAHLTENRWRYAAFLAAWFAFMAAMWTAMAAAGASEFATGLLVGVGLGALPLFTHVLYVALGLGNRSMGAEAEQWTATELAKLDHRWSVFHDVPLARSNVDHVVIGPGRVYAIETKWTSATNVDRFVKGASWQAKRQAAELAAELRARGAGRQVLPLLVVWGPGIAAQLGEKPKLINDVRVVSGRHAAVWRERMAKALDRLEADRPATQALLALLAESEASAESEPELADETKRTPMFIDAPPAPATPRPDVAAHRPHERP